MMNEQAPVDLAEVLAFLRRVLSPALSYPDPSPTSYLVETVLCICRNEPFTDLFFSATQERAIYRPLSTYHGFQLTIRS